MRAGKVTKLSSTNRLPETADETFETADETLENAVPETADEILEKAIVETADETLEKIVPETADETLEKGKEQQKVHNTTTKHKYVKEKNIKISKNTQKPDKSHIKTLLQNLIPCFVTLFVLGVSAFFIVMLINKEVESYCDKVYQENKEYFSYE